ncbi:MAG: D-alanyl-D-alanine carboxypeptidase family protein [Candidatus Rariloculaceae bacterium]
MRRVWVIPVLLLAASSFAADVPIPAPPQIGASSYILVDYGSGQVLAESQADERIEPASLTKLMTAYTAFHALRQNQIAMQDEVLVSEKAWRTEGSRMFIEVDTRVSVEDLLRGMIIQSGNDASVALAEYVAGSEETFVGLMNHHAELLGMANSEFQNTTGLPAENHYMTARDIGTLAYAIIEEFPEYYSFYSEREFTYNEIRQHNRNSLLWRDESVDGLKTGYTDAAGYCLVTSAERSGMRLVSVVTGMASTQAREDGSQSLLNYGFRFYESHKLYSSGDEVTTARVWGGDPQEVALGPTEDLHITVLRGRYDALEAEMDLTADLSAPIEAGMQVGEVHVSLDGAEVATVPLMTLGAIGQASLWTRIKDEITLWLE